MKKPIQKQVFMEQEQENRESGEQIQEQIGDQIMDETEESELTMKNERESMERESMNVREVRSLRRDREPGIANLPGVGAATVEKLEASGYGTLLSIAVASPGEIVDAVGMGEASARKVIQAARGMLDMGFESGDELLKRREKIMRISVGSENFNLLMNGGLETGAITECFGAYGSSKTQVAHQLAVNVQKLKDEDGNPLSAIYIDTENTFRPERICQFAKGAGFDPHEALKRIKVARAFNSDHQMLLVEKIEDLIQKEGIQVGLVIVDSLTAHFRAEFIGRGTLAERQQKLNRHMHALSRLASTYNLCVYVTNQVMAKPDQFFGDPTEAIGGHIVAHNSTFRIYLRKGKKGTRVAKLVDSPNLPDGEAIFEITTDGLRDV